MNVKQDKESVAWSLTFQLISDEHGLWMCEQVRVSTPRSEGEDYVLPPERAATLLDQIELGMTAEEVENLMLQQVREDTADLEGWEQ